MHCYQDLIDIFDECFANTYNTRLVKGDDEPIYLPADTLRTYNALYFAHGFYSSALHECSHWLIAGEERRKLIDFGYWYMPDGRNAEQQALFQKVEVKPQAIEWILSMAAGHKFRVSVDNLNGAESDTDSFKKAVHSQVMHYCSNGLPQRTRIFRDALCSFYKRPLELKPEDFVLTEL
ncbi:elongation factor P hydroxylase [Legionella bononiensis]|uniref:Elongation factor P hydroxylase n=1 Tax=Legionella bononiensis TaxID=2793102 RepID=A0ABS1WEH0_9GAMM|nr:elongation factor P hydroxylase [Legionella bononiensis]MBL7527743.1 elongation factor P hydroxylase [Legionella bononiensis]MBL7563574.1 elongation factor P hydroxylase [Legionella bononiensis]